MNMDSRTPQLISSEGQEGAGILTHPETAEPGSSDADYRVILYNDDWHGIDEVVGQVIKATACSVDEAIRVTEEAHLRGRAVCLRGNRSSCQKAARILREIRLQCEVDCD